MNIRHCLPKFITIIAAVVLASASSCLGTILSVPQYSQEKNNWCWDASAQMVLAYFDHSYSQTTIANWAVGGADVANYLYGSTDDNYHGVDEILSHFGSISSTGSASAMSLNTLGNEMAYSRPVVIRWGWDSGGGHILVLRGTDSESVYVNDPWYGQSINTYDWVCRGGGHTWTHTLQLNGEHHNDTYYQYCLYYYDIYQQYYYYYQLTGSAYYLAYSYYYYAYAIWYYYMYYGYSNYADAYYYYYIAYACYYYYYYYGYYDYAYECYLYYYDLALYYYNL